MAKPPHPSDEWEDPIVAEVRRARAQLFADAGNDLDTLCARLQREQVRGGTPLVQRKPRAPHDLPGEAA